MILIFNEREGKMLKQKTGFQEDPYVLFEKDIKPRPGFSVIDEARLIPRCSISRTYELMLDVAQVHRKRIPGVILCPGAACGINSDGHVTHFWPGQDLEFLGFLVAQGDERMVSVKTRGSLILKLPSAEPGNKVYCQGPDIFSLTETPGSAEIGKIRYCRGDDRCAVAFKREGDSRPLDLDLSKV